VVENGVRNKLKCNFLSGECQDHMGDAEHECGCRGALKDPCEGGKCRWLSQCCGYDTTGKLCSDEAGHVRTYEWNRCDAWCGLSAFADKVSDTASATGQVLEWVMGHIGLIVLILVLVAIVPVGLSIFRTLNWKAS
jgi:hypothetical protein